MAGRFSSSQVFSIGRSSSLTKSSSVRPSRTCTVCASALKAESTAAAAGTERSPRSPASGADRRSPAGVGAGGSDDRSSNERSGRPSLTGRRDVGSGDHPAARDGVHSRRRRPCCRLKMRKHRIDLVFPGRALRRRGRRRAHRRAVQVGLRIRGPRWRRKLRFTPLRRHLTRIVVGDDPPDGGENFIHRRLLTPRRLIHGLRPHFDRPRFEPLGGSNRIGIVPNRWNKTSMACRTLDANKLLPGGSADRRKRDPATAGSAAVGRAHAAPDVAHLLVMHHGVVHLYFQRENLR